MVIEVRWQRHLVGTLRPETQFYRSYEASVAGANGTSAAGQLAAVHTSGECQASYSTRLVEILKGLGTPSDVVDASLSWMLL